MKLKAGLQLKTTQSLTLTPQLQQAIHLLLLSSVEMQQEIQSFMESNPFLEEFSSEHDEPEATTKTEHKEVEETATVDTGADSEPVNELSELNWSQNTSTDPDTTPDDEWSPVTPEDDQSQWGADASTQRQQNDSDAEHDLFDTYSTGISLREHLAQQAYTFYLSAEDSTALMILVESINENGYLEDSLELIADQLLMEHMDDLDYELQHEDLVERLSHALLLLQSMEPAGIGARNLSECLTLQLQQYPSSEVQAIAIKLAKNHLNDLARRDYRSMAECTECTEQQVRDAYQLILQLNPKPGLQFSIENEPIVIPDIIVQKTEQGWQATNNPEVMPNIRINDLYARTLRQHKGRDGAEALEQRLQEARWFIRNIEQRFSTILRVSQAIINRQEKFFSLGESGMRPLVLREIADEIEMHESTISRVTTAKYMQTPFGVYELKYFFGSALTTEAGGEVSSTAVKALIKKTIAEEDPKKPLSDNALSKLLSEQGIQVARRTVAKYRDELKIPTASLRQAV